jgi:SAM-dependent methyltransferase
MNRWHRSRRRLLGALGAAPLALAAGGAGAVTPEDKTDGGPYVPTPWPILDEMLKLAEIRPDDVVYDLGSGDGRLVIAAAARHGARGVGVERHADLVTFSRAQAEVQKVADRVRFVQGDVLEADVREATVVMMYLLPRLVAQLMPKLRAELAPGARIVSHDYPLSPWRADKTLIFDVAEKYAITGSAETKLFYYVVPARIHGSGRWRWRGPPRCRSPSSSGPTGSRAPRSSAAPRPNCATSGCAPTRSASRSCTAAGSCASRAR